MKTTVMKDFSISYVLATMFCYAMLLPVIKMIPDSVSIFILTISVSIVALVAAVVHSKNTGKKPV